jgi:hypothetical protein
MVQRRLSALPWVIAFALACALPASAQQLPDGYATKDIGNVETPGSTAFDSATGTFTVTASGADVWGTEDGFRYVYTQLKGDGSISARLLSQEGGSTTGWGRNGLMIRETEAADSRHLIFCLGSMPDTPGGVDPWSSNGQFFSIRRINNGTGDYSFNTTLGDFPNFDQEARHGAIGRRELPIYARIQRRGNLITAYVSPDGKVWTSQIVPQRLGEVPLPETMLVGLAVSGMSQAIATMKADNVKVSNDVLLEGPSDVEAIPSSTDNRVIVTWSGTPSATGYTIYRQGQGETQFTKAGSTTDVTWFVDDGGGSGLKAGTNYRYVVTATVPQKVGADIVGVETGGSYMARATPGVIASPIGPFLSHDVGTAFEGSTELAGGTLTLRGAGSGVGVSGGASGGDSMRFVGAEFRGNLTLSAKILAAPSGDNKDGNVKAGLMVRESLRPGAMMAAVMATSNEPGEHAGVQFQFRTRFNDPTADESVGSQDGSAAADTKYPLFLRIVKRGVVVEGDDRDSVRIEGFQSADGKTYTKVGGNDGGVTFGRFPAAAYFGFFVTNQREGGYASAQFDATSLTFEP